MFRFMKGHLLAFACVMALLVVQSMAELSLPQYMSDIVDVGVGQGGIASGVPTHVRADVLADVEMFMGEEDLALVEQSFSAPNASGVRRFVGRPEQATQGSDLATAMELPEVAYLALQPGSAPDGLPTVDELREGLVLGTVSRQDVVALASTAAGQTGEVGDKMLTRRAVGFVEGEYRALGIDLDHVRSSYLFRTSGAMLGFCAVALAASVATGYVSARLGATIGRDTRRKVFARVMEFSPAEVGRFSQASLITRCTNDVSQVQMVIVIVMRMVLLAPIMGVVAVARVLSGHTGMEWAIVVAVLAVLGFMVLLFALVMPRFKVMQQLVDRVNLMSREMLEGIMPIRAFSREELELSRFDDASSDLMSTQLFTGRAMATMSPGIQLLLNVLTLAIVWLGAGRVDVGVMQVGDVMAFISYAMQIVSSFMMLAMVAIMMPRAQVSADRILEVLATESSITSPDVPVLPFDATSRGELAFDHVCFRYSDAEKDAVHDVSFVLRPGQTLGVVGSTGSGKSTLVQLIPRLYDVTAGRVTLDGVDVRDMDLKDLRSRIGYVPQQARLFSGTVASNVAFSGDDVADEDVRMALEVSQAAEFVDELPDGVESPIAQSGGNVSGGQRQRLAIARAIAARPEVLVLDDSFSALDYATDARLRKALAESLSQTSVVVVAQRVATVMHADSIVVLEGGRVVGMGTHDELLLTCAEYLQIAQSQLSPEELGLGATEDPGVDATEDPGVDAPEGPGAKTPEDHVENGGENAEPTATPEAAPRGGDA